MDKNKNKIKGKFIITIVKYNFKYIDFTLKFSPLLVVLLFIYFYVKWKY